MEVLIIDECLNAIQVWWRRNLVRLLERRGAETLVFAAGSTNRAATVMEALRRAEERWPPGKGTLLLVTMWDSWPGENVLPELDHVFACRPDVGLVAGRNFRRTYEAEDNPIILPNSERWNTDLQFFVYPEDPSHNFFCVHRPRLEAAGIPLTALDWIGAGMAKRDEEPRHVSASAPQGKRVFDVLLRAGLSCAYAATLAARKGPGVEYYLPVDPMPTIPSWHWFAYGPCLAVDTFVQAEGFRIPSTTIIADAVGFLYEKTHENKG